MQITPRNHAATPEENVLQANRTLEKEVLAHIIVHAIIPEELNSDSFQISDHKKIFSSIDNLLAKGETLSAFTIHAAMGLPGALGDNDGFDYLMDLGKAGILGRNIDSDVRLLNDLSMKIKVITFADLITTGVKLGIRPVIEIVTDAAAKFQELAQEAGPTKEIGPTIAQWPDPLQPEAFHGLAGEFVRLLEPHTESDLAALLLQFLVAWGSLAGRGPYYLAEADRHHTNLFTAMMGDTGVGRKGTSWSRILGFLRSLDEDWAKGCLLYGLGSGEALLEAVAKDDKRRLVVEAELARLLAIIAREGATISATFRQCWDSGNADITVRGKEVHAENAHLSMVAHITRDELLKCLSNVEIANGFGNRILWVCVRRSKMLPLGGGAINFGDVHERLKVATYHTRRLGNTRVNFDHDARDLWCEVYPRLSEGRSGLAGKIVNRAEAQTVRLSLIFALLDCSDQIRIEHLRAALAVWKYCEDSALYVWGDAMGDPLADKILKAVRESKQQGFTRWDINNLFAGHKKIPELDRAINLLVERGLIRAVKEETGGRSSTRYVAA